jgi:hypothetical protein
MLAATHTMTVAVYSTKSVARILDYNKAIRVAKGLQRCGIVNPASQMNRKYCLDAFPPAARESSCRGISRHKAAHRVYVGEHHLKPGENIGARGRDKGDRRNNYRITRFQTRGTRGKIECCGSTTARHCVLGVDLGCERSLKSFDHWAGGQPIAPENVTYSVNVIFGDSLPTVGKKRLFGHVNSSRARWIKSLICAVSSH